MKIVDINQSMKHGSSKLAADLRDLAAKVEAGEVDSVICAFVFSDQYQSIRFASLADALILVTLLHDQTLKGLRGS